MAKAGDADMQPTQQQRPVPQDQETQPKNQAIPPNIVSGYAYGSGSNDALAGMELPGNTRTASVPNIRGSVIASLDYAGTLDRTPYQPYGASSELRTPFGYIGQPGSTYYRNNPLNLV
jgi:hypothetical protein